MLLTSKGDHLLQTEGGMTYSKIVLWFYISKYSETNFQLKKQKESQNRLYFVFGNVQV